MKNIAWLWKLLLTGLIVVSVFSSSTPKPRDYLPEAQELFERYSHWKLSQYPEYATCLGISEYDEFLTDMTENALVSRLEKCRQFLEEANELFPLLTQEADIFNMKILMHELNIYVNNFDLKGYYMPINYQIGIHISLQVLLKRMSVDTFSDYEVILKRLEKLPAYIDQTIHLMKAGVENNITQHEISMKNLNESIGKYIVDDPTQSEIYALFNGTFPSSFTSEQIKGLQKRAQSVITHKVVPSYINLLRYIQDEYSTRKNVAITSIPRGEEFYNALIEFYTNTKFTAKEIHDIGLREVRRLEKKMLQVIKKMGREGMSPREFAIQMRDDPQNYFNTSMELIAAYEDIVYNRIDPAISHIFKTLPKTELKVEADPTPKRTGAFYRSGNQNASQPGVFHVYTDILKSQPKYRMISLALHEANPGHHLGISYLMESPDIPLFRKQIGGGIPNSYPSKFPSYTYMIEGWALYAESLGYDMDLYRDPIYEFGHINEEMYRAVRLVTDTGLHSLNWTKEEAVDYMSNYTAFSAATVENEIDRYITIPGQALAYKMGQLKITLLRGEAEARLGEAFDLKEFHEIILRNSGPLNLVDEEVRKWIQTRTISSSTSKFSAK